LNRPALPVFFTPRAVREIEEAARWWEDNRPGAPGAIHDELARGLEIIASEPASGAPARTAALKGVRRILLTRVGYFVYYRVAQKRVQILAFWHTRRGRQP
jgi:toxin ParE1/3/4